MSELEWIGNDFKAMSRSDILQYARAFDISEEEAHSQLLRWRIQHVQGEPRATEYYTSEELAAHGIVGLYRRKAAL